jgi:hypothetical protein
VADFAADDWCCAGVRYTDACCAPELRCLFRDCGSGERRGERGGDPTGTEGDHNAERSAPSRKGVSNADVELVKAGVAGSIRTADDVIVGLDLQHPAPYYH